MEPLFALIALHLWFLVLVPVQLERALRRKCSSAYVTNESQRSAAFLVVGARRLIKEGFRAAELATLEGTYAVVSPEVRLQRSFPGKVFVAAWAFDALAQRSTLALVFEQNVTGQRKFVTAVATGTRTGGIFVLVGGFGTVGVILVALFLEFLTAGAWQRLVCYALTNRHVVLAILTEIM